MRSSYQINLAQFGAIPVLPRPRTIEAYSAIDNFEYFRGRFDRIVVRLADVTMFGALALVEGHALHPVVCFESNGKGQAQAPYLLLYTGRS